MNVLLFDKVEIDANGRLILTDRRALHIQKVLKSKVNDQIRVGEIHGSLGKAKILDIGQSQVILQVYDEHKYLLQKSEPASPAPIQVILALPRPKALGRVLESLTELGIKKIHVIHAAKVEKSYWSAHQLKTIEIQKHLRSGLEIAVDTVLPEVHFHNHFRPFVEDVLPRIAKDSLKFVAHPYTATQTRETKDPYSFKTQSKTVAIGPEGGWTDFELDFFLKSGFHTLQITPRILSSETSASAVIGHLLAKES